MRPSELDPERWRAIDGLLEAALEVSPEALPGFLDAACSGDPDLRTAVEALLAAGSSGASRFESPGPDMILEVLRHVAPPAVPGGAVGPFRLVREIGRGGMGVVYLAEDRRLGRPVALKVLAPWLGAGADAKLRFEAEARAVSALDHPNIATLYEIDESEDGQLYMAFAFYRGETLAAVIERGALGAPEAVGIAAEIASGLDAAHRSGVVHRDVKPSNVLLTEDGTAKLLDFGVAKIAGEDVTGDGVRLGTVAYMSPEQLRSETVDERTDLWSLGVVLHEMLTGAHPFDGDEPLSIVRAILDDEPEPLGAGVPDGVKLIVEKLLSQDRGWRYQSAAELLEDLHATQTGDPPAVARREPPPARRPRVRRLGVLPLVDMTGSPGSEHLVHGIHDALIAELGKIRTLGVVSRTSVLRFHDTELPLPEIADMLDVDALVEGSVSRVGEGLGLTAQLLAVSPERHLWAATYRCEVTDVLSVAAQAAASIAAELAVPLTPSEESPRAASHAVAPDAYEAYTMGLLYLERRSPEGHELAQRYLRRAIELDPGFAPAYAMLAEACGSAAFFGLVRPSEGIPVVRTLVEKALSLDPTLPAAHTVLGAVRHFGDWDWPGAEAALRRAISLNPSYAYAHFMLADVLSVQRRYTEALASAERHRALEKFVPFAAFGPMIVLTDMRDFDRALERGRAAVEFFTDFWQGPWLLAQSLLGKGMYREAVEQAEIGAKLSQRTPMALGGLGQAYALSGQTLEAERVLSELEDMAGRVYVGATNLAMILAGLGDHDGAFDCLERAYRERDMALVHLGDDVFYDPLRSDPRFGDLLRRMGLEPGRPRRGTDAARPQ